MRVLSWLGMYIVGWFTFNQSLAWFHYINPHNGSTTLCVVVCRYLIFLGICFPSRYSTLLFTYVRTVWREYMDKRILVLMPHESLFVMLQNGISMMITPYLLWNKVIWEIGQKILIPLIHRKFNFLVFSQFITSYYGPYERILSLLKNLSAQDQREIYTL